MGKVQKRLLIVIAVGILGVSGCSEGRRSEGSPCPDGAKLFGKAPPDGYEQWCRREADDGTIKKHGIYRSWHENGQLKAQVSYRHGVEHGRTESWYDNGQPLGKGQYKDGKPTGTMTTWHQNGRKQSEKRYSDGAKHGLAQIWDDTGRLSAETHYRNDVRDGIEKLFEEDGSRRETNYSADEEQWNKFYDNAGNEISLEEYVGSRKPTER